MSGELLQSCSHRQYGYRYVDGFGDTHFENRQERTPSCYPPWPGPPLRSDRPARDPRGVLMATSPFFCSSGGPLQGRLRRRSPDTAAATGGCVASAAGPGGHCSCCRKMGWVCSETPPASGLVASPAVQQRFGCRQSLHLLDWNDETYRSLHIVSTTADR